MGDAGREAVGMEARTQVLRIVCVVLLNLALTSAKGAKKKTDSGGGGSGMVTCMTSYLGLYNGPAKTDDDYIGLDYSQIDDEWESNMFDAWVADNCVRNSDLPEEQETAGCYTTSSTDFPATPAAGSTVTMGPQNDITVWIPHLTEMGNYTTSQVTVASNGKLQLGSSTYNTERKIWERCVPQPTALPKATSPCDPDNDFHVCDTYSPPTWSCNVTNVDAFYTQLRAISGAEADDCWTTNGTYAETSRCEGAPVGPVACKMPPALAANESPIGLKVVVNGDRCRSCSLKQDLCPVFFDVHNCEFTWEMGKTPNTKPSSGQISFTVDATVNSANRLSPAAVSIAGAVVSLLLLMNHL